jgi:hypothetical protein
LDYAIGILLGISLAASCGFRVFVPLLVTNIFSLAGWVHLSGGFEWMGTWISFAIFLSATIVEISAYYIPWLDNALDTIAVPLAAIAGTLLTVSFIADFPPAVRWVVGIIAGGGTAAIVKTAAGAARLGSSAVSGGITNWIVATAEHIASLLLSILSFLIPVFTGILAIIVISFSLFRIARWRKRRNGGLQKT